MTARSACGAVLWFARIRPAASPLPVKRHRSRAPQRALRRLKQFYRVFRWIAAAVVAVVVLLVLHTPKPPAIVVPPDAEQIAEGKIRQFESSAGDGVLDRLELEEPELNGWLGSNLALKDSTRRRSAENPPVRAAQEKQDEVFDDADLREAESTVRSVKIKLNEDRLRVYALFDLRGVDLSLELEGRISAQDGYLRFEPSAGKLGSLPLLAGSLQAAAQRLFDSPENREKFKLPPYIEDIRVDSGRLVISSR